MTAEPGSVRPGKWRRRSKRLRSLVRLSSVVCTGLALAQELRKPADRRRWHGVVLGYVPYDFRLRSSRAKYRDRIWSPDGPLLQPHGLGVGWTLNIGRLLRLLHLR